ncbi:MAG: hypothetical protein AAF092_03295 [Pseudomonadota bacterium]
MKAHGAAFLVLIMLGGCTTFDVVDEEGNEMYAIQRGVCFVGCDVRILRADGKKCSGFAADLQENQPANVNVYCDGEPHLLLTTDPLNPNAPTVAHVSVLDTVEERNAAAVNAALAHSR